VYYRLKQVDADGKYTFSSVVKLALGLNTSVVVYPNPFNTDFTITFSATKNAPATLKLINSTGQLVFSKTITVNKGNNSILVNSLPSIKPGIYYMSVGNEELNFNSKLQKK
ncbi:MAG: T9SS type A sorting domain-containing protein, partial [Ginsengibacter sp.]